MQLVLIKMHNIYIYITIFVLVCPDLINIHFAITGNHKTNNHIDVFTFHVEQQFSTYIYLLNELLYHQKFKAYICLS